MSNPIVSIIIPFHNMAPWIPETIESVLEQTFKDFQCILVDDGSTDASVGIIQTYNDPRLQLIQQSHKGVSAARNTGLEHAKGQYIAFLDSDDLWAPKFLEHMLAAFEVSPNSSLAWCDTTMFIDQTNTKKYLTLGNIHRTGNLWWDNLQHMSFTIGAFLTKIDAIKKIGLFDTNLIFREDSDFILRLLAYTEAHHATAPAIHISEALTFYRIRKNTAIKQKVFTLHDEWNFMKKHLEHPNIPSQIRKKGYSNLAFKLAVLAVSNTKDFQTAFSWYLKAVKLDPFNLNLYFLPLKRLLLFFLPQKNVTIPTQTPEIL